MMCSIYIYISQLRAERERVEVNCATLGARERERVQGSLVFESRSERFKARNRLWLFALSLSLSSEGVLS